MKDLFAGDAILERVPMAGADVSYSPGLPLNEPPEQMLNRLIISTPWKQESIVIFGKSRVQPRLTAWFGGPRCSYTYSGITLAPVPWTPLLTALKEAVENFVGGKFNSVLLNYYRDNNDSMGFHSDDEGELGLEPVIASLSFGEERTFVLKHRRDKTLKPVRIKLASGSLLLMQGETQRNWKHSIDKERRPCGPRVNLTFRRIILRSC